MATNTHPISLCFTGPNLKTQGVPILELGQTLVTLQRLVYKAYLYHNNRSPNTSLLKQRERKLLSLGIASQEKGSDIYHLEWYAAGELENFPAATINKSLLEVAKAASLYTQNRIDPRKPKDGLAVSMINDLQELTDRIGRVGGIAQLEIRIAGRKSPILIDESMKSYVTQLKGRVWNSTAKSVRGVVVAPHTFTKDHALVYSAGQRIKAYFHDEILFREMLGIIAHEDQAYFEFRGTYRLRIGEDASRIKEFDVAGWEQLAPGWPRTPEGQAALAGLPGRPQVKPQHPKPSKGKEVVIPPVPKKKGKPYLN